MVFHKCLLRLRSDNCLTNKKLKICWFVGQVSLHCVGDARQQYILEAYNLSSVTMVTKGSALREVKRMFLLDSSESNDISKRIQHDRASSIIKHLMNPMTCFFGQNHDPDLRFVAVMHFFQHGNQDVKGNFWLPILDPSSGTSRRMSQWFYETKASKDSRFCLPVGLCSDFFMWCQHEDEKRMRNLRPTPFSHTFPLLPLHRNLVQRAFQPASAANPAAKIPVPHHFSLNLWQPIPARHRNCTKQPQKCCLNSSWWFQPYEKY